MFRIFGPPGTGKTTTLLNMVDDALASGIAPNRIAFFAFTKKAANEARERAAARFNLDPKKDLVYFRTLHSMALAMTDIQPTQVIQDSHYKELGEAIGVRFGNTSSYNADNEVASAISSSDPVLGLINLAKLRKVGLREQYNLSNLNVDWNVVSYIDECLTKYKQSMGLYDFTDMLQVFIDQSDQCCPRFELTFLDEAQDLCPMQWDIAHILDKNSNRMYAAGDDDQAIYRWAGADVDHFINLEGGSETLSQSYRVPSRVHEVAENVVKRITKRFPKRYEPRAETGQVSRINMVSSLDMSDGSWLILSQAAYHLQGIANDLKSSGYLFSHRGNRSISEKISDAVNGWEQLRKGMTISGENARKVYAYMSLKNRVKKGFKKLPALADEDQVSLEVLQKDHGLVATIDMIWSEALDKIPESERAYITAMLRRGEKFNGVPRISTSTIHGSKGGEADNVVLITDLSPAADDDMRVNPDDIHRVFYVGVTRTRDKLYIVEPEDVTRSYYI
jgi:superfamily I DNA/RNA helicase